MKIRYTATAIADVDEIFSYIAKDNPRAAERVLDAIEATVSRLGMFPYSAPETDEPGLHMAPAGRFPYLIFYTVAEDEVRITRVRHGARRRPGQMRRKPENEGTRAARL